MKRLENASLSFFRVSFFLTYVQSGAFNAFLKRDLTISYKEKQTLDRLLKSMEEHLPHDYMKTDIFLIRWLRAADSDLEEAKRLLKEHLRWRAVNKVDAIAKEDFDVLKDQFPIHTDAVDYYGAPILTVNVVDWDIRRAALSGQADILNRYLINRLEEIYAKLRAAQDEGLNVTRIHFIEDLRGYNLAQHACLPCLTVQIRWLRDLQIQYPGLIGHVVYINAPTIFEVAVRALLSLASSEIQDSIKIFGTNRKEWEKFISEFVPPDQLEANLGGTKETSF